MLHDKLSSSSSGSSLSTIIWAGEYVYASPAILDQNCLVAFTDLWMLNYQHARCIYRSLEARAWCVLWLFRLQVYAEQTPLLGPVLLPRQLPCEIYSSTHTKSGVERLIQTKTRLHNRTQRNTKQHNTPCEIYSSTHTTSGVEREKYKPWQDYTTEHKRNTKQHNTSQNNTRQLHMKHNKTAQ